MARESIGEKAVRYLETGRLRVTRADVDHVAATCAGRGGAIYHLGCRDGRWSCSCPARRECAHLRALMLVTSVPASRQLAAARAHARFHDARSEPPEAEPEPEFETVAGQLVIDTCPSCGTVERVAVHDGLCPECTSAPPASYTPRRPQPSRPPF